MKNEGDGLDAGYKKMYKDCSMDSDISNPNSLLNKRETAIFCLSPPDSIIPSLENFLVTSVAIVAPHLFKISSKQNVEKSSPQSESLYILYADKLSRKDNEYIGDSWNAIPTLAR